MKITAYKSKYTREVFTNKRKYEAHLKGVEKAKVRAAIFEKMANEPRLYALDPEDFQISAFHTIRKLNKGNPDRLLLLEFKQLRFGDVRNTHSAPIGGVENFRGEKDKPWSYPGWNGRIVIVYSSQTNTGKNREKIEALVKKFPGINTGSGSYVGKEYKGVKGYVCEYDLRLYASDFPRIKTPEPISE